MCGLGQTSVQKQGGNQFWANNGCFCASPGEGDLFLAHGLHILPPPFDRPIVLYLRCSAISRAVPAPRPVTVARHAPRKAIPGEPNELSNCPTIARRLTKSCFASSSFAQSLWPSSADVHRVWSDLVNTWLNSTEVGQVWPMWGGFWPKHWPKWGNRCQALTKLVQIQSRRWPCFIECGPKRLASAHIGQKLPELRRSRQLFGNVWTTAGHLWSSPGSPKVLSVARVEQLFGNFGGA